MNYSKTKYVIKFLVLLLLVDFAIAETIFAQTNQKDFQKIRNNIVEILSKIKNHFVTVTPFYFIDRKTGDKVYDISKLPDVYVANLPGGQNVWTYEMGVVFSGFISAYKVLNDKSFLDFTEKNYKFVFDNLEKVIAINNKYGLSAERWRKIFEPRELDDCGSMGAALIKLNELKPDKRYNEILNLIADYIYKKQLRLEDGTFVRKGYGDWKFSLWTDDLYMSVPFLVQAGKYFNDTKYYDDAVKQVLNFAKYLFVMDKGLFDHGWFDNVKYDTHIFWGRQNGWAMLAIAELLDVLPKNYVGRDLILDIFQRDVKALIELQDETGLWHQVLDKPQTYLETSCSAMYAYAIAKGVNEGWIEPQFAIPAFEAWNAIEKKVTEDGQILGVCMGTSIGYSVKYYAERPQRITAYHGFGPVLLAGSELIKLLQNFNVKEENNLPHFWRKK